VEPSVFGEVAANIITPYSCYTRPHTVTTAVVSASKVLGDTRRTTGGSYWNNRDPDPLPGTLARSCMPAVPGSGGATHEKLDMDTASSSETLVHGRPPTVTDIRLPS
jgi:hypothetical protein